MSYGSSSGNKYISYYFRKSFTISSPAAYTSLTAQLIRDDGAVVYINGTEVKRSNISSGTVTYSKLASTTVSGNSETAWNTFTIPVSNLVAGTNVIAVEVHQVNKTSPDVSFNFSLSATMAAAVCNVPSGLAASGITTGSANLSWVAATGANSYVLQYKKQTESTWTSVAATLTSQALTGLTASTLYEYKVQSVCSSGSSAFSSVASFTTLSNLPPSGNVVDTLVNSGAS